MIQRAAVLPQPSPLPIQISETLRHISLKLNERGFVLRKRRAYVIEQVETGTIRALPRL